MAGNLHEEGVRQRQRPFNDDSGDEHNNDEDDNDDKETDTENEQENEIDKLMVKLLEFGLEGSVVLADPLKEHKANAVTTKNTRRPPTC